MVSLNYNIQGKTLELENNLSEIQANINQVAQVGAAADVTQKEMKEFVKAISEISAATCHSASEAGNALKSLMYRMQDREADIYNRIGNIEQDLSCNYATRAETSEIIENLELKAPF